MAIHLRLLAFATALLAFGGTQLGAATAPAPDPHVPVQGAPASSPPNASADDKTKSRSDDKNKDENGERRRRSCMYADYKELRMRSGNVAHHPLLTTSRLVGAGSQTELVLAGISDIDLSALDYRVFYIKPAVQTEQWKNKQDYNPPEGDARVVAENLSGTNEKAIAAKLQIQEAHNALLQVDVVEDASSGPLYQSDGHIVVVACKRGEHLPVLWAETSYYWLSPVDLPIAVGILVVFVLYAFCALVVYSSRRAQEKEDQDKLGGPAKGANRDPESTAQDKKPLSPYRIEPLKAWSWRRCFDPVSLTSDIFDHGSLANLQILFFSLLVAYGLIYIVLRTGELSSISVTVVELLGVSAIGSLGSKVVGTNRNRLSAENWAWLVSRRILPLNDPGKGTPHWRDLIMSDTELDLYKLQALTFSVIVGMGMIAGGFTLATFSVPNELLEVLGLSQLVFVGGRLAKPASMGDLDNLLDELRKREAALKRAASTGVDVDGAGEPLNPAPARTAEAPQPPYKTMAQAGTTGAVPNAVRRYQETMVQVKAFLEAMASRKVGNTSALSDPLKDDPAAA